MPTPTTDFHPSEHRRHEKTSGREPPRLTLPTSGRRVVLEAGGRSLTLTNLDKPFWPDDGITKAGLLQYYADVSPWLLPHLRDRAMVMRRYPDGAFGQAFFMKRAPAHRPEWLETCAIAHSSGNVIDFPVVQDLASLLWVVNLGCIDLNQWYARCDDVDRPDYLHFDLDPGPDCPFEQVLEAALILHDALSELKLPDLVKTSGSRGMHVYVPIVRGPTQKQVWTVAKALAVELAAHFPGVLTSEYRVANRPKDRVLVDYNQNAWGRTLASIYSVRPKPQAPVSMPVTWRAVERGLRIEDFRLDNVPGLLRKQGDGWATLLSPRQRFDLAALFREAPPRHSPARPAQPR